MFFFLQGNSRLQKMEIKGVIKNLIFFFNLKMVIVKICLGISLELLRAVWGQFSFR